MIPMDFQSWRCMHDMKLFCPPEGCPKHLGCVRDRGWKSGDPTPRAYQGYADEPPALRARAASTGGE